MHLNTATTCYLTRGGPPCHKRHVLIAQQPQGKLGKHDLRAQSLCMSSQLPHALCTQAECLHCRLTNHGLEAPVSGVKFEASDGRAAGKALQRLRSDEAADGSTATKASGQQTAQDRIDVKRVEGENLKDHTNCLYLWLSSIYSHPLLLQSMRLRCQICKPLLCLDDQTSQRVTALPYSKNS